MGLREIRNKIEHKEVVCFRFDPDLKERFRKICNRERRTTSQMVALVLEKFIADYEKIHNSMSNR